MITEAETQTLADSLKTALSGSSGGTVVLFQTNVFPGPTDTLSALLTPCNFPGYTDATLITGWTRSRDPVTGDVVLMPTNAPIFAANGAITDSQTAYGYLFKTNAGTILGAKRFATPVTFGSPLDSLVLDDPIRFPLSGIDP